MIMDNFVYQAKTEHKEEELRTNIARKKVTECNA